MERQLYTLVKRRDRKQAVPYCLRLLEQHLRSMNTEELMCELVSTYNRVSRRHLWSCQQLQLTISIGDICYFDFGQAYLNEAGYQHFGLVISEHRDKFLVLPMTSNTQTVTRATVNDHLFAIGQIPGLHRPSVLFLNDARYVNSSRVIAIHAHLDPQSQMFREICAKLQRLMFPESEQKL